jgi:nicotinamidase-related amidase
MEKSKNPKAGLEALLTPENCVVILIDHQPFQFAGLRSHDSQTVISNVVGLAKTAKIFKVPALLTTVLEENGGLILKQLQDEFPEQKPINRTSSIHGLDRKKLDSHRQNSKFRILLKSSGS